MDTDLMTIEDNPADRAVATYLIKQTTQHLDECGWTTDDLASLIASMSCMVMETPTSSWDSPIDELCADIAVTAFDRDYEPEYVAERIGELARQLIALTDEVVKQAVERSPSAPELLNAD